MFNPLETDHKFPTVIFVHNQHPSISNKKTFLQDFLVILKPNVVEVLHAYSYMLIVLAIV